MSPRGGEIRPADVRRALEARRLPPVWLWAGPEEFLKDELWRRTAAAAVPAGLESMNVSRFRAGEDDAQDVVSACRTLPMMAERRAVIYRDVERLSKGDEEVLTSYLGDPSPDTVLVLASRELPGSGRNRRLAGAGAETVVFWIPFERDAIEWIRSRFRELGKSCDTEAARDLLQACGAGPGQTQVPLAEIAPEVEKVALGMGERTRVQPDDVEGIGRRIDEALRDDVLTAFAAGDVAGALRALDGLLLFKEWDPVRLLANLTHRVLALARVRELQDAGASPRDIASGAGVWPKQLEAIQAAARAWRGEDLRRCLTLLARADRELKSTGKPARIVLEHVLLEMASLRGDGASRRPANSRGTPVRIPGA